MPYIIKKALHLTAAAALLASVSACTNTQGAPNMVDYSYVPSPHVISLEAAPGIESW